MYVTEANCVPRRANSISDCAEVRAEQDKKRASVKEGAEAVAAVDDVYPDGGYGWVIMAAFSCNVIFVVQLSTNFGLILIDVFKQVNMRSEAAVTIMTFNQSFSLLLGLITGGLMRRYGYRKVALVGAVLNSVGMALTAVAHSFVTFMITYGVIMSAGAGLTTPAFSVALNTYFKKRRSLVTGVALGLTGISGILFPKIVYLMLRYLGPSATCLSCGGVSVLAVVAAAFLDPVEQHRPRSTAHPADCNGVSVHGSGVYSDGGRRKGLSPRDIFTRPETPWRWFSRLSADLLDVKLLSNAVTMNLLVGLAISSTAELTFKTMLPFILEERTKDIETSTYLSVSSGMSALSKLSAPVLQSLTGFTSRGMYVGVLLVILCARTVMVLTTGSDVLLMTLMVVHGFTKGTRTVFCNLVMPDNVDLEQLPYAIGLQAVFTGIFLLVLGPVIGVVLEKSSSYNVVIMTCNVIMAFCILVWTVELLVGALQRRCQPPTRIP